MTAYTGALKKFSYLRLGEALRMYASKASKFTVGQMTYEISAYAQYLRRMFQAREEYIAGGQGNMRNLQVYRGVQSYGGHFTVETLATPWWSLSSTTTQLTDALSWASGPNQI